MVYWLLYLLHAANVIVVASWLVLQFHPELGGSREVSVFKE